MSNSWFAPKPTVSSSTVNINLKNVQGTPSELHLIRLREMQLKINQSNSSRIFSKSTFQTNADLVKVMAQKSKAIGNFYSKQNRLNSSSVSISPSSSSLATPSKQSVITNSTSNLNSVSAIERGRQYGNRVSRCNKVNNPNRLYSQSNSRTSLGSSVSVVISNTDKNNSSLSINWWNQWKNKNKSNEYGNYYNLQNRLNQMEDQKNDIIRLNGKNKFMDDYTRILEECWQFERSHDNVTPFATVRIGAVLNQLECSANKRWTNEIYQYQQTVQKDSTIISNGNQQPSYLSYDTSYVTNSHPNVKETPDNKDILLKMDEMDAWEIKRLQEIEKQVAELEAMDNFSKNQNTTSEILIKETTMNNNGTSSSNESQLHLSLDKHTDDFLEEYLIELTKDSQNDVKTGQIKQQSLCQFEGIDMFTDAGQILHEQVKLSFINLDKEEDDYDENEIIVQNSITNSSSSNLEIQISKENEFSELTEPKPAVLSTISTPQNTISPMEPTPTEVPIANDTTNQMNETKEIECLNSLIEKESSILLENNPVLVDKHSISNGSQLKIIRVCASESSSDESIQSATNLAPGITNYSVAETRKLFDVVNNDVKAPPLSKQKSPKTFPGLHHSGQFYFGSFIKNLNINTENGFNTPNNKDRNTVTGGYTKPEQICFSFVKDIIFSSTMSAIEYDAKRFI